MCARTRLSLSHDLQNEDGIKVCNEDGDLLIQTDGTGFISEDLARKCPTALLSARYLKNKKSEVRIALSIKYLILIGLRHENLRLNIGTTQ